MRILWLGPIHSEERISTEAAANKAAANWQTELLSELKHLGVTAHLVSHVYERLFPKGSFSPGKDADLNQKFRQNRVAYCNLPILREWSLKRSYVKKCIEILRSVKGSFDFVVTYNCYPWHAECAKVLQERFGIRWINLALDFDEPGEDMGGYDGFARAAYGHVFLSWWAYVHSEATRKLHLDSGTKAFLGASNNNSGTEVPFCLYCGKISELGGLKILRDTVVACEDIGVEFVICGKGSDAHLGDLAQKNSKLELRGYISDDELTDLSRRALCFLNPRPPDLAENRMIFPSKVTSSLVYGKPIISTWTDGLHPEFKTVLKIAKPSGQDFKKAIVEVLGMSDEERGNFSEQIRLFIGNRSWRMQAIRFKDWLSGLHERAEKKNSA